MTIKSKDEFKENLVRKIVDSWDLDTTIEFCVEHLFESMKDYSDDEILDIAENEGFEDGEWNEYNL